LQGLSTKLKKDFGRGFSVDNLENMRRFYITYSKSDTASRISSENISEIMSRKSENVLKQKVLALFNLSFLSKTSQRLQATQEVFMSLKIQVVN